MKSILLIFFFTVIIGGAAMWYIFGQDQDRSVVIPEAGQEQTPTPVPTQDAEPNTPSEQSILERLQGSAIAQTAELEAVDGSASSGTAYRLASDGTLAHSVTAEMPPPANSTVYEGWLVQPSPLEFFSTGVMEQRENGTWVLEFEATQEYPTYTRVVITEEAEIDETPERHVIEGDF